MTDDMIANVTCQSREMNTNSDCLSLFEIVLNKSEMRLKHCVRGGKFSR